MTPGHELDDHLTLAGLGSDETQVGDRYSGPFSRAEVHSRRAAFREAGHPGGHRDRAVPDKGRAEDRATGAVSFRLAEVDVEVVATVRHGQRGRAPQSRPDGLRGDDRRALAVVVHRDLDAAIAEVRDVG